MKKTTVLKIIIIVLIVAMVGAWKDFKRGFVDAFYEGKTKHSYIITNPTGDNTFDIGAVHSNLLFNF